ncbi:MAG TPA: phosphotransferase [Acidimicrobiales bacterium]|nr:phosphotransferase [Acidimicrobiales bacterium]
MDASLRAAPTTAVRQWVADAVGAGARVTTTRRLTGGVTSSMHALGIEDAGGRRHRVVLRRWDRSEHPDGEDRVHREARVLGLLAPTDVPAPLLVASDPRGERCDAPALLMSFVPGRLHLSPDDPDDWVAQMAELLARIHDTGLAPAPFDLDLDLDALEVPSWTRRPGLWRDAISIVRQAPPTSEHRLLHRDYQQFNLLWRGDRLVGVVDWVFSSVGPPSVDVAHGRLNLTLLYSPARAEQLRAAYESIAGRPVEPWWDLAGMLQYLPGWGGFLQQQAGRRLRLDFAGMHDRVEEVVAGILGRL